MSIMYCDKHGRWDSDQEEECPQCAMTTTPASHDAVTLDEQIAPIVLDALMGVLQQAIEFPSPSSSDPYSEPICILVPGDAEAILTSLRTLKQRNERIQDATMPEPVAWISAKDLSAFRESGYTETATVSSVGSGNCKEPLYGPEVLDLLAAEKSRADEMKMLADYCKAVANEATDDRKRAESRLAKVMEALRECRQFMDRHSHRGVMEGCPDCALTKRVDALIRSVETPS